MGRTHRENRREAPENCSRGGKASQRKMVAGALRRWDEELERALQDELAEIDQADQDQAEAVLVHWTGGCPVVQAGQKPWKMTDHWNAVTCPTCRTRYTPPPNPSEQALREELARIDAAQAADEGWRTELAESVYQDGVTCGLSGWSLQDPAVVRELGYDPHELPADLAEEVAWGVAARNALALQQMTPPQHALLRSLAEAVSP